VGRVPERCQLEKFDQVRTTQKVAGMMYPGQSLGEDAGEVAGDDWVDETPPRCELFANANYSHFQEGRKMGAISPASRPESKGCSHWQRPGDLVAWRHARPTCASLALAFAMLAAPAQAQDTRSL
jgi:hypothetical protein